MVEHTDSFGNILHIGVADKNKKNLFIDASGSVLISKPKQRSRIKSEKKFSKDLSTAFVLKQNTFLTQPNDEIESIARSNFRKQKTIDSLLSIASEIKNFVKYKRGVTGVKTSANEAWKKGFGVCQDHAHIMLGACRSLGLSARYVSGYLQGNVYATNATHAWVEVWLNEWVGIDVTNGCSVDDKFLILAVGTDYLSVAPIRGLINGGGEEKMSVNIEVS